MKKILLFLLVTCISIGEIHGQAKQRKELLLQIAALQIYIGYAKKGYNVVKKGLNFIGDLKKGEVNLHSDYFNSLKNINPKVKNYSKIAEIILLQIQIIKSYKRTFSELNKSDLFHGDELDYMQRSFDRLLDNCNATLDELLTVTTEAKLEMTDDQRIERIDKLYQTMMDDYGFCENFCREAEMMYLSKAKENNDVKSGRVLHGL